MTHVTEGALRAIAKARQSHAPTFDLHGLGLTVLPSELPELTWLDIRDLGENQLTDLDPGIKAPSALYFIDLSHNGLQQIDVLAALPLLATIRIEVPPSWD